MKYSNSTIRAAAVLSALTVLQGCAPPQENVFYDPWDQYALGHVYDCGNIQVPDVRLNTENSATPGFGCAHQSNLTVMISDPADLQRPRASTPPDAQARARVLTAYRDGDETSTAPAASGSQGLIE